MYVNRVANLLLARLPTLILRLVRDIEVLFVQMLHDV